MDYVESNVQSQKKPSIFGGACIIACVCIGAGMLGLPAAGAGAWTLWSVIVLSITMLIMSASGCLLLEALKDYPYRSSFSSVTKDLLGKRISFINNVMIYFVGGILLYAYITSSGLIIHEYFGIEPKLASILFVVFFSIFVWHSTKVVDRISVVLLLFMGFSFVFSVTGLVQSIDIYNLVNQSHFAQGQYVFALLPVALASFGYHHTVSSMRDYYLDERRAQKAILGGTFIALCTYLIWLISVYGNLSRTEFPEIIAQGGDINVLLQHLKTSVSTAALYKVISAFSAAAILSSFIGIGLGVFDFLADALQFEDNKIGRTKTWLATFIPPLVISILFPFGFLVAIGYASAAAAIWACIIPAMLVRKVRLRNPVLSENPNSSYRVIGGDWVLICVSIFGALIIFIQIVSFFGGLPTYGS
ncbi:aromatic amino acid transporter [Vibrio coralliilyticus]|uniref:aromatic amino acid transporter n=1 Tax=Vibrio coralliilyticus TaxID=190893 RepID=UPI000BAACD71|nr:aromatic amino acid transporter [Vibrio coralliilyticus]NOI58281.1 transposase [Vibrio coralliilyticus]PAT67987.1 transposase [Vibrio coralliilyticus]